MLLGILLKESIQKLAQATTTPQLDAEVLFGHVLNMSRAKLMLSHDLELSLDQKTALIAVIARRHAGEPIAYITGNKEFWSLSLHVSTATLIPRPETELLVEVALTILPREQQCLVTDLGTGSGAIALALAHERPHWQIWGLDISPCALEVARQNALNLSVSNVNFIQSDWFANIPSFKFDALISNPPYISEDDCHLQEGDVRFEPQLALVAQQHGYQCLDTIIDNAMHFLKPGGWLLLEHGHDQASELTLRLYKAFYQNIVSYRDLAGIYRVIVAQKP